MPEAQLTEPLDHAAEKTGRQGAVRRVGRGGPRPTWTRSSDEETRMPRTSRPSCRPFTVERSPRRAKPSR